MNNEKFKKMIKNNKGITMISLVVIIIILIILAGVSSEILIGENGIITRAEKSREEQKVAELGEKLELVKAPTQVDKLDTVITVDEYLEELQKPKAVDFSVDEIERVDEDNAYVTVEDRYVFLIEYKEDKNLIITYQGKVEELKPRIIKLEVSNTTNSITAKVEAKRVEKYKFYIKNKIDEEYEYKEENKKGEYVYSNLEQNKEYYIKVEAINKNGQVEREVKHTTGGMPVLTVGELISTTTPEGWVNTNKTTKIEIRTDKDISGVRLQYTKLPENATTEDYKKAQWKNYTSEGIESEKNETIAIRLWDGTNETSRMAVTVDKIDKTKPVVTSATANTNTITIQATDEASGIVGYTVTENTTVPTSFTSCTSTKSLNVNIGNKTQGKTYYVWVKDAAGNVSTYKQVGTSTVTKSEGNITFTYSSTTWTNQDITVTANTTITGYKLQTSTDAQNWKDETSQKLTANGKVYARLADSTNQATGYAVANVDKIDKTKPVVTSATANTNTITIKATDEASGIVGYTVTENTTVPTSFTTCNSMKSLNVNVGNKTQGKTYYVWVKDAAGNVSAYKQVGTSTVTKSEGNITFTYSSTTWTNQDITVTANTTITGYKLQTSTDAKTWKDETSQKLSANGKVYARLADSTNQATGYAVANVDKIDKTKPVVTSATANTNTITIQATDEASGIVGYTVTENTTVPTSFTTCNSMKSLNVNVGNKTQGKTYYVWVKDAAGNVSAYKQVGTSTVTKSEGNITFTYSSTTWTNQDITVTANTTITGYKLQTSTDAQNWKDETSQKLSANGKVYARLADSTNQATGYAVANVDKIDKTKPIVTLSSNNITSDSITIVANVKDDESGIDKDEKYRFFIKETNQDDKSYVEKQNTSNSTYIATGLKQNTGYTIKAEIKDNAGNVGNKTIEVKTLAIYTVTLNKDSGVSSVSGAGTYSPGEKVTITANVLDGYSWKNWTGTEEVSSQSYTFVMPEKDVVYTANTVSNFKKYSLKYKSYDWICPNGDDKKGTMTMQYVNITAENSKYLTSIETAGSQTGNVSASNLLTGTYTDVQNVGKSLTATKSGITEHNTNTMTENVTMNFSFPTDNSEYSVQFSIYGSYIETGGSTQSWSYWHGNSGGGCNVFTISKEQLENISKIYVDNVEKTFSSDTDFTIYQSSVADKRKGLHTYSHTIKIIFK